MVVYFNVDQAASTRVARVLHMARSDNTARSFQALIGRQNVRDFNIWARIQLGLKRQVCLVSKTKPNSLLYVDRKACWLRLEHAVGW